MVVNVNSQSEVRFEVCRSESYKWVKIYQANSQFETEPIKENIIILWGNEWNNLVEGISKALSKAEGK